MHKLRRISVFSVSVTLIGLLTSVQVSNNPQLRRI
uniref:Uncharacterized protein n=1 Tax=Arundo donax TaxID=35708 RepID=A0A0A9GLR8_ARUDO